MKAIFFDYGKTIHDFHLDRFFGWLSRISGADRHYFWDLFGRYPGGILFPYECGQRTEDFIAAFRCESAHMLSVLRKQRKKVSQQLEFTDKDFITHFNLIFSYTPPPLECRLLIEKLYKAGYALYILSNLNQANLAYIKNNPNQELLFGIWLPQLFSHIVRFIASCDSDIQCRKTRFEGSNAEERGKIFWKACAIAKVKPHQAVFIDDIFDYAKGFEEIGGHGIHFVGHWTRVESELYKLGVRW